MYTSCISRAFGAFSIHCACRGRGIVLAIATLACTSSFAATCPVAPFPGSNGYCIDGLVPGSYPYFETSVDIKWRPKKSELTAMFDNSSHGRLSLFHVSDSESFAIAHSSFDFSATINESGATGHIAIYGNIDALGTGKKAELMSANLTGVYGQDGNLLGFNTMDIVCNDAINAYIGGCTTNEVIYFALDGTIDLNGTKNQKFYGTANTSVPLPATVWLFGSGLLGLIEISRRKKVS